MLCVSLAALHMAWCSPYSPQYDFLATGSLISSNFPRMKKSDRIHFDSVKKVSTFRYVYWDKNAFLFFRVHKYCKYVMAKIWYVIYESNLHQHKQIDMLNMIQYKSNNASLKSSQIFKITFKLINTCCVIITRSDVTLKTILKAQFFNHIKPSDSDIKSLKVSFFFNLYNHI